MVRYNEKSTVIGTLGSVIVVACCAICFANVVAAFPQDEEKPVQREGLAVDDAEVNFGGPDTFLVVRLQTLADGVTSESTNQLATNRFVDRLDESRILERNIKLPTSVDHLIDDVKRSLFGRVLRQIQTAPSAGFLSAMSSLTL